MIDGPAFAPVKYLLSHHSWGGSGGCDISLSGLRHKILYDAWKSKHLGPSYSRCSRQLIPTGLDISGGGGCPGSRLIATLLISKTSQLFPELKLSSSPDYSKTRSKFFILKLPHLFKYSFPLNQVLVLFCKTHWRKEIKRNWLPFYNDGRKKYIGKMKIN